jgi:alkylated DNA repair dioxygenase AlkB
MDLKRKEEQVAILLEPCSLLLLRGEARYRWTHGIPRRQQDRIADGVLPRQRRVSITFRKVILES